MPCGVDMKRALAIMDWAYEDPQAEAADPEGVGRYRDFVNSTCLGSDEALWRRAFDQALLIWRKGWDLRRSQVEGLF